ncbi:hypothetical protein T265_01506 [Opisthorchis viverrini]|uniref:Uncharacterized protein n=1 Tax=Opisthorchis viverrini TaxID=6198 RepID=A0A075AIY7_OPIVI|nr:hypothetical protein T265_01506 [Opisthorchis viverrini]KER32454.1 hypothetical protein T265_01506 [Opisthorchis viverrini]
MHRTPYIKCVRRQHSENSDAFWMRHWQAEDTGSWLAQVSKLRSLHPQTIAGQLGPRDVHLLSAQKRFVAVTHCAEKLNVGYRVVRGKCLKNTKRDTEDFIIYASVVNRECECFQPSSMTEDQFVFVADLQSPHDADIRTRLLNRIEQDPEWTLQKLTTECQYLINLKTDGAMIGYSKFPQHDMVCKVTSKKKVKFKTNSKKTVHNPLVL